MKKIQTSILAFSMISIFSAAGNCQDSAKFSISGISSGAFFAAQMGVIYSDRISGVATIAGGFYFCAGNYLQDKLQAAGDLNLGLLPLYQTQLDADNILNGRLSNALIPGPDNPLYQSLGVCMGNPERADLNLDILQVNQQKHLIAEIGNIRNQRFYFYQGHGDSIVRFSMLDKLNNFYSQVGVPVNQIKTRESEGAHNFPTDRDDENSCSAQSIPYISSCGIDAAGELLGQLLNNPNLIRSPRSLENSSLLHKVSQKLQITGSGHPKSIAKYGYLAASPFCLQNPGQCQLHVALHGCEMSDSFDPQFTEKYLNFAALGYLKVQKNKKSSPIPSLSPLPSINESQVHYGLLRFALESGYLEYVKENHLMVLFPQTWITADNFPLNPKGCWDWYGWTGPDYATNKGSEAKWLMSWVDAIQKNPQAYVLSDSLNISEAQALGK